MGKIEIILSFGLFSGVVRGAGHRRNRSQENDHGDCPT